MLSVPNRRSDATTVRAHSVKEQNHGSRDVDERGADRRPLRRGL